MSLVTDLLDRLSGVTSIREDVARQERLLEGIQRVLLIHERAIAELKGSMRAIIAISNSGRAR